MPPQPTPPNGALEILGPSQTENQEWIHEDGRPHIESMTFRPARYTAPDGTVQNVRVVTSDTRATYNHGDKAGHTGEFPTIYFRTDSPANEWSSPNAILHGHRSREDAPVALSSDSVHAANRITQAQINGMIGNQPVVNPAPAPNPVPAPAAPQLQITGQQTTTDGMTYYPATVDGATIRVVTADTNPQRNNGVTFPAIYADGKEPPFHEWVPSQRTTLEEGARITEAQLGTVNRIPTPQITATINEARPSLEMFRQAGNTASAVGSVMESMVRGAGNMVGGVVGQSNLGTDMVNSAMQQASQQAMQLLETNLPLQQIFNTIKDLTTNAPPTQTPAGGRSNGRDGPP